MKKILFICGFLAFAASPALADHDHGKKKDQAKTEQSEHDHGEVDENLHQMADDHPDNGVMDHGAMDHGEGHMMGSTTMPTDGAVLSHSPKMIGVKFGHAMKIDAITVSTLTGEMIELDVQEIGETDHVMVKAPELQPDDYIVDWRAKGSDGHIMSGSFSFTVE